VTLLSLSACVVTNEAAARHSTQIFHVLCMMLLGSIEIHRHRLVKQKESHPVYQCARDYSSRFDPPIPATNGLFVVRPLTSLEDNSACVGDWESSVFLGVSLPRPGEEELPP
jgi:hypothetical protein